MHAYWQHGDEGIFISTLMTVMANNKAGVDAVYDNKQALFKKAASDKCKLLPVSSSRPYKQPTVIRYTYIRDDGASGQQAKAGIVAGNAAMPSLLIEAYMTTKP